MVSFTRTHTLVLVAVLVVLVLIGVGCWWRASSSAAAASEAFVGAPRFNGRPTACRLHKVFAPTEDDDEDPLLRLYVIDRTTGKPWRMGVFTHFVAAQMRSREPTNPLPRLGNSTAV